MHKRIFRNFFLMLHPIKKELRRKNWGKLLPSWLCLFFFVGTAIGQNNITLSLGEESILLDQLVVCGNADEQRVLFAVSGNNQSTRSNITATLQLFDGIQFDQLNSDASTAGVTLINDSNPNQPIFSFPDLVPNDLSELAIVFSVKTDCSILDTLTNNSTLQVFDTWLVTYDLEGETLTENFTGTEYKDAIATPNLNLFLPEMLGPFSIGSDITRTVTITNSGLNSYLKEFTYQVIQEPGLTYKSLTINGQLIEFTKEISTNQDSLILANISGDFFINNTKESGVLGNEDNLFDVDEILTIIEIIEVTSCGKDGDSNLSTMHQTLWGCQETICSQENKPASISIGVGEELIEFVHNKEATINAGYCEAGNLSIRVSNNGFEFDDGFGTILNISAGVGFAIGSEFLPTDQGYQVNSITIAGTTPINAPNGLISLDNNPAFTTDPDGEGGLEDFDGDGFFDDLGVGQSFEITATYSIDCVAGNAFNVEEDCDNDLRASIDGKISYSNACGLENESLFDNFFRSSVTGGTKEVCADPDAFNNLDEFTVIYSGERRLSNFDRTCQGDDEIRVNISLPNGILLSNKTTLQQDTTQYSPRVEVSGSNTLLTFDAAAVNLNNDYELNFVFETQCAPFGPTSFPVDITYYCPDCDCSHIWYCGVLEGAVLHSTGQPCEEFTCETGIQTTNFEVERTTFGYEDIAFTIPIDTAIANKKVALACDSVVMRMSSIVGMENLTDSVGLIINYGNADGKDSEETSFLFNYAEITISSGGNTRQCIIDTTSYRIERVGNNKLMYFDLASCMEGIGLNSGDRIEFNGHFAVNSEGPIPTNTFKKIPEFRARSYAIIDGITYDDCDSYGEFFRLGKLNTTFSGPSNSSYPEGCEFTAFTYTLTKSINANAMREFFGEEHRQAVKVDNFQLLYDPAILDAFEDLSVEYNIQGSQWLPLPNLREQEAGIYNAGFSLLSTASTITGSNQVFRVRVNLIPGCSSLFGGVNGDNSYETEAKINYQDRYFASEISDGSCVAQKEDFDKRIFQYDNPPQFSLEGVIQEVETAADEVQWVIEHCNTSFVADAGLGWLEIENLTGSIEVLMIEDISESTAIDTLSFKTFGNSDTQIFAFTNGLIKRSTNANPADICNTFRITAKMNACGESTVAAKVGWACTEYTDPNWNPSLYTPCEEESIVLKASSLIPFLSASFQENESSISGILCDTSTMVILVRNEERGNAYDVQSQIILPNGATLVAGSIEFAYPSTAPFIPITTEPTFLEDNELGKIYQYEDFEALNEFLTNNGLPGFNIDQPDSSEFKIKYRFITNCEYENGEVNRYSFQGLTPCGEPSNNAFAETNPIIFQADPSVARAFDINFSTNQPLAEGQITTLEISIQNTGINLSADDKLEIELPLEFEYIANSATATAPNNWVAGEPIIKNSGEKGILNWLLPVGLAQNETAILQFQVNVGALACDSTFTTKIATTSSIEFTCTIDNQTCVYDFLSSNEDEFPLNTSCEPTSCIIKLGTITDSLFIPDCDSTTYYCLEEYTPEELEFYTISDNGVTVDSSRYGKCNFQQVCIYTYASLFNVTGNIQVDSWTVDGVTYSGTVANMTDLVDSMNVWDEGGNWILLPDVLIIQGGHTDGSYSQIEVTLPTTGARSFLGYDTRLTPRGVSIFVNDGFHQFILTDNMGCRDTLNVTIIKGECICVPPTVLNTNIIGADCGQTNGVVSIELEQTLDDYSFIFEPNLGLEGATKNARMNLPSGDYEIKIIYQEDTTCQQTITVNIPAISAEEITLQAIEINPSNCGRATGTAEIFLVEDMANYNFTWTPDVGTNTSGQDMRINLPAGDYEVLIAPIGSPECGTPINFTIPENELTAAIIRDTIIEEENCEQADGQATLLLTESIEDYNFIWTPDLGQTGNTRNSRVNLPAGTYEVQLVQIDNPQCNIAIDLAIGGSVFDTSIIETPTLTAADCGQSNGAAVINIDGNIRDYLFIWTPNLGTAGLIDNSRINLPAGTYEVQVAHTSAPNCTTTISVEVPGNEIDSNLIGTPTLTAANCSQSNGAAVININGTIADYTYDWIPNLGIVGATDNTRNNLPSGTYEVQIAHTSAPDCTTSISIEVPENEIDPNLIGTPTLTAADCGQSNGAAVININGTITDYTYDWIPNLGIIGATDNSRTSLPSGTYEVQIAPTSAPDCRTSISIEVPENEIDPNLIGTPSIIAANCGQNNGEALININGTIADYTYNWIPNLGTVGETNNSRIDLPAGIYEVQVSSTNNSSCTTSISVEIPENEISPNLLGTPILTPSDCGQNNGTAIIEITDNITDYNFNWPESAGQAGDAGNSRVNLMEGEYAVTITSISNSNCSLTTTITIPLGEIGESTITDTLITNATCGQANGQVEILVREPITNYNYEWSPNVGTVGISPNIRSNLPAGVYEIKVVDTQNTACFHSLTVTITETSPTATATIFPTQCSEPASGTVVLIPETYTYNWADGFVGNNRNLLAAGTYEITFFDPNQADCEGSLSVEIEAINTLVSEVSINKSATCEEPNGSATITTSGGSGNYSYSWDSDMSTKTDLAAGDYSVTVFDATLGCQTVANFTIENIAPSTASVSISDTLAVSCLGESDGGIRFAFQTNTGFQLPLDTIILNEAGEIVQNGQLAVGDYCLEIRDNNDCLAGQACFTIKEAEPLLIEFETVAACADTGSIDLTISGGTSPFIVDWLDLDGIGNPSDRVNLDSGLYEVVITDGNGCMQSVSIRVPECEECNLPTITEIATTPTTCTGNTGSVFIKLRENVSDYDFMYIPEVGQPFVTGNIRASMPKGRYKVMVIYKPNPVCILEIEVEIEEKNFDDLVPITSPSECGFENGQVVLIPSTNSYIWEDGYVGDTRENLAAGFYNIMVRDDEYECETAITIIVDEINLLESKIAVNTPPTCGNADGSVTLSINKGSGDYSYSWDADGATKNDLPSGTYRVLVTDNRTGCVLPVIFTLLNVPSATADITINETTDASCPLSADGTVDFSVNIGDLDEGALDTMVSNGLTFFQDDRLPQGEYCLSILDTFGCIFGQTCFTIDAPDFLEIKIETIPECEIGGIINTEIIGGQAPFQFDWADIEGSENDANRKNLRAGFYSLTVTDANGCQAKTDTVRIIECEPCPIKIGKDTLVYHIEDCDDALDICLDYDIDPDNPFSVVLDGITINPLELDICSVDTIDVYSYATLFGQGRLGTYTITSWPVNNEIFTGTFNTLDGLVDSMNVWDPQGNWTFSDEGTFIIGGAQGNVYDQMDAAVQDVPVESFLSHSTQVVQRGINTELEKGIHEMTIQNPKTFCEDTLILVVNCTKIDTMVLTTTTGQVDTVCFPTNELAGTLTTSNIDCQNSDLLDIIIHQDSCVIIRGLNVGDDTVCVILCDEFGVCDTTIIEIDILYEEIVDTVEIYNTNTICLDTTGLILEGSIMTMREICQADTTEAVKYDLNLEDRCISYTANVLGQDTACIEVCDNLGLCDTIQFFITIKNDVPDNIGDTIFVNETVIYCFDSLIFPGKVVFFENVCPDNSGNFVDFFLDPINFCVEYGGVDIGTDSACVVICDEFDNCDTATFNIEVVEFGELPTAVNDADTTDKGVPIVLNVKENDIPFGVGEDGMMVVDSPEYGIVVENLDGSITYFGDEFCERTDQFTYSLCNPNGCDTATVTIYIKCIDIVIFTAVSPNRDGFNDEFYISNIEEFPNSMLKIYNRWGNIVYQTTNYQNDWTGTWKGNQELPDGTYFYQLQLNDKTDTRKFEGFIELHR